MYKKMRIELVGSNIMYSSEKTLVRCTFQMRDQDKNMAAEGEPANYALCGSWLTEVEFDAGTEPTKDDILAAVLLKQGVVSSY